MGTEVKVYPYTALDNIDEESEEECEDDIVIKVSGVTPTIPEEMLRMVFESKHKSGGGKIANIEVDFQKGEALLTYADSEGWLKVK